ncbi:MAG TPA: membrane protein insertase YidC [Chloroflexia bacterium]
MEIFGFLWNSFWHLLLNILVAINSVVPNAGISIIIFTLLMRLLTVPLTMKALKSSRNMQQIQPLIKEVQKKHGKDRAKQQEELMKIYAEYGINPAASCFPMLIQLPIFIGLYSALTFVLPTFTGSEADITKATAAHLEQLRLILWNPGWVDTAANFGQAFLWVPNLARAEPDPIHIWPILSGAFQFIQSRMAMPVRDPNQPLDPQTRMMHNMMQFMPIYIIFISWGFPTGTVIYWAFSSIFGAVQQYFITGFGSLPDLPGLGWLPRKPIEPPKPIRPRSETEGGAPARPVKKGMMAKMMERALEAQEAQKAAQGARGAEVTTALEDSPRGAATRPTGNGAARSSANGGEPTRRTTSVLRGGNTGRDAIGNGSGGEQKSKGRGSVYGSAQAENDETPRGAAKYASDVDLEEDIAGAATSGTSGNGASAPAQLPRKRKNKR